MNDYDDKQWVDVFLRADIVDNLTRLSFAQRLFINKPADEKEQSTMDEYDFDVGM